MLCPSRCISDRPYFPCIADRHSGLFRQSCQSRRIAGNGTSLCMSSTAPWIQCPFKPENACRHTRLPAALALGYCRTTQNPFKLTPISSGWFTRNLKLKRDRHRDGPNMGIKRQGSRLRRGLPSSAHAAPAAIRYVHDECYGESAAELTTTTTHRAAGMLSLVECLSALTVRFRWNSEPVIPPGSTVNDKSSTAVMVP
jgi:hypothetical protein